MADTSAESNAVKLNVSGVLIEVHRETLNQSGYFHSMLSGRWERDKGVYVDEDPELFKHIINYLRYGGIYTFPQSLSECYDTPTVLEKYAIQHNIRPPRLVVREIEPNKKGRYTVAASEGTLTAFAFYFHLPIKNESERFTFDVSIWVEDLEKLYVRFNSDCFDYEETLHSGLTQPKFSLKPQYLKY